MTPLTPTEIEELRIAIAESVGWERGNDGAMHHANCNCACDIPCQLPPYTTSLDAIQQAAVESFKDENGYFQTTLREVAAIKGIWQWQIAPLDWCIAFARTARIWRYKV